MFPRSIASSFRLTALNMSLAALAIAGFSQIANADQIPYGPIGTPNPVSYTFTATGNGDIDAWFAGSSASYNEDLSMLVNGVATNVYGLPNHGTPVGTFFDMGAAAAGDTITFVIYVQNTNGYVYSDPSLNGPYDSNGSDGHNHVYATPYTGDGSVVFPSNVPTVNATYVAFEDLSFPGSDFDYNDTSFVVTGVTDNPPGTNHIPVPDGGSTLALMGLGFAGLAGLRRRFAK